MDKILTYLRGYEYYIIKWLLILLIFVEIKRFLLLPPICRAILLLLFAMIDFGKLVVSYSYPDLHP